MEEVEKILNSLVSIRKIFDSYKQEKEKAELYDSNRFNPFQFIKTDENGLSHIIAFLLDPKETHGQRDLFLNSFLKYLKLFDFLAYDSVSIVTEKSTVENRRHDIFIEASINNKLAWVLSIENKLRGAADQIKQLDDYEQDLKRYNAEKYHLVYMPVYDQKPNKTSTENWDDLVLNKQASIFSAKNLIEWLNNTVIVSPIIRGFCDDFIKFLEEDVLYMKNESNDIINNIIDNDEFLYTVLEIISYNKDLYSNLILRIVSQLNSQLDKYPNIKGENWRWNSGRDPFGKLFYISLNNEETDSWGFCIEFQRNWFKSGYYGIYMRENNSKQRINKAKELFLDASSMKGRYNGNWVVNYKLPPKLYNWDSSVWLLVNNGELVRRLSDEFEKFLKLINENIKIIESIK